MTEINRYRTVSCRVLTLNYGPESAFLDPCIENTKKIHDNYLHTLPKMSPRERFAFSMNFVGGLSLLALSGWLTYDSKKLSNSVR